MTRQNVILRIQMIRSVSDVGLGHLGVNDIIMVVPTDDNDLPLTLDVDGFQAVVVAYV